MSLHHTLLKTSLLLGSLGLVGVAVLRPAQAETMIGQSLGQAQSLLAQVQSTDPAPNPELSPNSNRQNPRLAQGQGRGQGPGSGQRCGPGRGQRGAHLTEAATQLGVTEEALRSALGIPAERPLVLTWLLPPPNWALPKTNCASLSTTSCVSIAKIASLGCPEIHPISPPWPNGMALAQTNFGKLWACPTARIWPPLPLN